jgi:hypothetical protein
VALGALALAALAYPALLPLLFRWTLGAPLAARLALGAVSLAPLGVLMGMPFPRGIAWLERMSPERASPDLIPWAWGVNGAVSVVASALAALVSLTAGFTVVLVAGAACYGVAAILVGQPAAGLSCGRAVD